MTVDHHELYVGPERMLPPAAGGLGTFRQRLAPQDFVVSTYLGVLVLAVLAAAPAPARERSLATMLALFLGHAATVTAVRTGRLAGQPRTAALAYRVATYGTVQATYFLFQDLLPLVNPRSFDRELHEFDLAWFGVEPAAWFDRMVTPLTTDWFAFFYFGYFLVLALHVIPILLFSRNDRALSEFALGMLLLFGVGHTLYLLVPGFGPYRAMPELFSRPLSSVPWWNLTEAIVAANGAEKDIFPSLHTGAPTFMVLYAFRRRAELPYRYSWPLLAFFAVNIVTATMFLRWHYVVDVVAGLLLAGSAHAAAVALTDRELRRRSALGLEGPWPPWPAPLRR